MIRVHLTIATSFLCNCLFAQSPSPQPTSPPGSRTLIDSLAPSEIEEALRSAKANFVDPGVLKDQELNRATLEGLLSRSRGGVMVLPGKGNAETPVPFFSEVLLNHIAYLRLGAINADNLRELDSVLGTFGAKHIDAMVLDLRVSGLGSDFDMAAEIAKRFVVKGRPLWTLHKTSARQDRTFTSDRDPAFQGVIMVLVDAETAGAAEAITAALKTNSQTVIIGQSSAGQGVDYSDFPLASGKILRVAVAEVIPPGGQPIFPAGIKPDIPVEMSLAQKREIFSLSVQRGMAPFVFESERPHFNEAALIAGTNPELDLRQQRRGPEENLHDAILQRAIDVVTSLAVFSKR